MKSQETCLKVFLNCTPEIYRNHGDEGQRSGPLNLTKIVIPSEAESLP